MNGQTIYLTREGFAALKSDLDRLQTVALRQASERIRCTEEFDDASSEAARYDHAFIRGRIAELERTLASAQLIHVRSPQPDLAATASRQAL